MHTSQSVHGGLVTNISEASTLSKCLRSAEGAQDKLSVQHVQLPVAVVPRAPRRPLRRPGGLFSLAPSPSPGIPAPRLPSAPFAVPSGSSALRAFPRSGLREPRGAWERAGRRGHAHWGRRTAHAGRWRAGRPEPRGSSCSPPARVPGPRVVGQRRVRPRAGLGRRRLGAGQGPGGCRLPGPGVLGAAPEWSGRRRESSQGARARGGRPGSMSQQRPARKLPSLLVDPAEETVRRRCRDPINVEGLLVSPGKGGGPSGGVGVPKPAARPDWPSSLARGCSSVSWLVLPIRSCEPTGLSLQLSPSLHLLADVVSLLGFCKVGYRAVLEKIAQLRLTCFSVSSGLSVDLCKFSRLCSSLQFFLLLKCSHLKLSTPCISHRLAPQSASYFSLLFDRGSGRDMELPEKGQFPLLLRTRCNIFSLILRALDEATIFHCAPPPPPRPPPPSLLPPPPLEDHLHPCPPPPPAPRPHLQHLCWFLPFTRN